MAQTDSHSSALQLLASSGTGQTPDPFWTRKQSRVGGAVRKREEWLARRLSSAQHTSSLASEIYTLASRRDPLLSPQPPSFSRLMSLSRRRRQKRQLMAADTHVSQPVRWWPAAAAHTGQPGRGTQPCTDGCFLFLPSVCLLEGSAAY